ncbi:uncharacterized protein LOC125139739 isoform X2 [Tachysurus fulvidraco]|uniref:uncharacterized protein LOC125139739 isoform X2 n=2 Tax=Tachysurus fulvidraco TaxID=1234273 RepID=UPI001FEF6293|nr:uncharacterized protein LOC125139739 isoform X2 [Tachysurus fulvidraco]
MELRLSNSSYSCFLWLYSFALCAIIGLHPVASIEVYTPAEVFVENGTAGILKCTFKSNQVISSQASVSWSFIPESSLDSTGETDEDDDDEETTSAVTEVDNASRSTEYIPRDFPTDEGPSTSAHNLSRLPAKELYNVHLQKQIRKSDMEMDLIQLQMEEKRLLIKKAALEIKLLEHRLKEIKK